jgi:TolA-binding protein
MRISIAGPLRLGLLLLAFLTTGCAYFNTFYLAKKYYREGQKAQERSVLAGVAPEAATRYDMTIRQCTKVLTEYPKSKWADDAAFLLAAALYGKGDNATAIRRLEEFHVTYPQSPFRPEARLIEGLSHLKRRDYADADSIFTELARTYPKFPRAWDLYFHAGESRAAQRAYPLALDWYARAVKAASGRRQSADALRRTGEALVASGRADSAIVVYERALRAEERSTYRLDVALRRAEALRDLGRFTEAETFLAQWRPNAIVLRREGELLLRLHEVQARNGRVEEAIAGYRRLVELNPNTPIAYDAQFRIGYLYESSLGDYDAAAAEYEKLRQGPPSEFQTQANRRSQGLDALKLYRERIDADTTQTRARAAFLVAELYYFQLDRPDSAMLQYESVERDFPNSVYAPKSAYARLWITALDRADTSAAGAMTDTMTVRYRGTRFAESALYLWKRWSGLTDERTVLLDSLLANPDTTGARRFLPEEADTASLVPPTALSSDAAGGLPPEMIQMLAARRAALLGKAPPTVGSMSPEDSVAHARADSLARAVSDSVRAAGMTRDIRRSAPDSLSATPPDSTPPPQPYVPPAAAEPSDSTTIFISPTR